jgi:hypothetical protein
LCGQRFSCPLPRRLHRHPLFDLLQKGSYQILRLKGSSKSANKPPAFELVTAQRVVEEQNGEIPSD